MRINWCRGRQRAPRRRRQREARGCQDHRCAQGAWWHRFCGTHGDSAAEVSGGDQMAQPTLRTSADGGRHWERGMTVPCEEEV